MNRETVRRRPWTRGRKLVLAAAAITTLLPLLLLFYWSCQRPPDSSGPAAGATESAGLTTIGKRLTATQAARLHSNLGIDAEELARLSPAARRRVLWRLQNPDQQGHRQAFYRLETTGDRLGRRPRGALLTALRQVDDLRARMTQRWNRRDLAGIPVPHRRSSPIGGQPPTALLPGNAAAWTSLGPENVGGRTRSIVIDPDDPRRLWVASVAGGIWYSEDQGRTFSHTDEEISNLAVTALVMVPSHHEILYAGTGEGFGNLDAIPGGGIYRSVDRGRSWSPLTGTAEDKFQYINRIAVSNDGLTLLVATDSGLYRGEMAAANGAVKWEANVVLAGPISCVVFDPRDPAKAIAGDLEGGRAYFSTTDGRRWTAASASEPWAGRVELTYAAASSKVVYASVTVPSADTNQPGRNGEIWRSLNAGASFERMATEVQLKKGRESADYLGNQGSYANVIWAGDPDNPNLVLVGGLDLWKSLDGGNTLERISQWSESASVHGDQHAIVGHPQFGRRNRTVFFGNDGGLYSTDDLDHAGNDEHWTAGWKSLNQHYVVAQFYSGGVNPRTGTILGGTQDNGTLRRPDQAKDGGWTTLMEGDGGWCEAADYDAKDDGAGDRKAYSYGEYIFLSIFRSSDDGATAEYVDGRYVDSEGNYQWRPRPYMLPDSFRSWQDPDHPQALFIAPFALDPGDGNRIFAGGRSLWLTDDARSPSDSSTGPAWLEIKKPLADGQLISALAIQSDNSGRVWVGYDGGALFVSDDATAGPTKLPRWRRPDGSASLPTDALITSITIDPAAPDTVYLTYASNQKANVWKTDNGGVRWSNLGSTLPATPVRTLTLHPANSSYVYIGTDVGIFASENGGKSWGPTEKPAGAQLGHQEGPNTVPVYRLFWKGQDLLAATHGRGMFRISIPLNKTAQIGGEGRGTPLVKPSVATNPAKPGNGGGASETSSTRMKTSRP